MTRSWTDPRTGKRWHIDAVSWSRSKRPTPGRAQNALLFESNEASYEVPTTEAARLETLEDDRLAALLDEAKENRERG